MFCTHCGSQNSGEARFCQSCGNPLPQQPGQSQPPPLLPEPPPVIQPPPIPQGGPPPVPGNAIPTRRRSVSSMNKTIYRILIGGGLILSVLLTVWGATDSKVDELLAVSWIPFLPAIIAIYIMIYKMWAAIQDPYARTTPGKAVGFMFIPLFNLYWIFQVFYGWAKDYNAYVARYSRHVAPVSENLFLIYVISSLICFPAAIVLLFIVIGKISDAANAL